MGKRARKRRKWLMVVWVMSVLGRFADIPVELGINFEGFD
jgi:hypothetical protein